MPSVSQLESPPSSPKSPPRKRTKFSLKLKNKKKANKDDEKREKLYPIFSPQSVQEPSIDDGETDLEPPKPPLPHAGLRNHGNTCYANAVLQVLRYCPGFEACVDRIASMTRDCKLNPTSKKEPRVVETDANNSGYVSEELDPSNSDKDNEQSVVCQLRELLHQMTQLEEDYIENKENCEQLLQRRNTLVLAAKPLDFMETFRDHNPMFEGNLQHDAQEFLCSLLVNLQDTEKETERKIEEEADLCKNEMVSAQRSLDTSCEKNKDTSDFEELFQGRLLHQTKCMTCEEAKKRFENFQDISVPVQKAASIYDASKTNAFSPTPKKIGHDSNSLCWALSQFATIEHLTGENKYFCDNCLTHTEAEITTCFDKLPRIFTIHLKRFTANALSGFSPFVSKITSNLETPMQLSIKEWCSKSCPFTNPTYHLFGIVMHSGMTSCSGHYQAYVKVPTISTMDVDNNNNNKHLQSFGNEMLENCSSNGTCQDKESQSNEDRHTQIFTDTPSGKLFAGNTCETSPTADSPQRISQTPDSSAEKAKTTCISGITRYFHKSRKFSTKGSAYHRFNNEESLLEDDSLMDQNTPASNFAGKNHDQSLKKIQSFSYHGSMSSTCAIRQLKFQDGESGTVSLDGTKTCITCNEEASTPITHTNFRSTTETFRWIHFDDTEVQILDESDLRVILSSSESAFTSPYLLFYKLVRQ